jgi:hypothetical protein
MSAPLTELEYTDRVLKRAQYEAFEFSVDGRTVHVRNGSHANPAEHEYEITVEAGVPTACTCPADDRYDGACKHRVGVAIRTPVLQACATAQIVADGGNEMDKSVADPEPCPECTALGDFPCWECVRTGRKELPG